VNTKNIFRKSNKSKALTNFSLLIQRQRMQINLIFSTFYVLSCNVKQITTLSNQRHV